MANKKGNNYIIDEENNIAKIELRRRRKESLWVTIDLDDLDKVLKEELTDLIDLARGKKHPFKIGMVEHYYEIYKDVKQRLQNI